ncbi:MAG TPA: hypothetical protein VIJ77_06805 [Candidatus Tumulicola sp.]
MDSRSRLAFAASIVSVLLLIFALEATHKLAPSSFKAFYCAGRATLERANPYEIEPLRSCEHAVAPNALPAYAVEPAPLPGYALAPWALIALLPAQAARALFYAILIAALAAASLAISKLTPLKPALVLLALLSTWFLNLSYGEIPPIATACVALAALALASRRPWLAALFATGVALEPHLAFPLWIALFIFAKTTRVPLLVAGLGLAVVDVAIGGSHQALAYFVQTLPGQALSEVGAADQFSLTHLAVSAGLAAPAALRLGLISYLVMTVAGVLVAKRLAGQGAPEYLALVPPAFVLLGGTYVHDIQFYAALPLALVLLARAGRPYPAIALATLLLAVSWSEATSRLILVSSGISVFAVLWAALPKHVPRIAYGAAGAVAALALVVAINRLPAAPDVFAPPSPPASSFRANDQAAPDWSAYVVSDRSRSTPSPRSLARKVPVWCGMLLLIGFSVWLVVGRREFGTAVPAELGSIPARAGP